jgi:hypothetical protein
VKLKCRAATSKARNGFSGGILRDTTVLVYSKKR